MVTYPKPRKCVDVQMRVVVGSEAGDFGRRGSGTAMARNRCASVCNSGHSHRSLQKQHAQVYHFEERTAMQMAINKNFEVCAEGACRFEGAPEGESHGPRSPSGLHPGPPASIGANMGTG
eukprot:1147821-Pelagomonas_calceolata.AAC.14